MTAKDLQSTDVDVGTNKEPSSYTFFTTAGDYWVWVDTILKDELKDEGLARELVHRIQNMRRAAGFDIADRIISWYVGDERITRVMERHGGYIRQETLSLDLRQGEPEAGAYVEEQRVEGITVRLGVQRAT